MPPLRVTATRSPGTGPAGTGPAGTGSRVIGPPPGVEAPTATPTVRHASATASRVSAETASAAVRVAAAKVAKSASGPMPEVRAAYQTWPARSQALPPRATAARW